MLTWPEPYYKDIASLLLRLALNAPGEDGPIRSSTALMARMDPELLVALYEHDPDRRREANPRAMAQHYLGWALVAADRISTQTAGGGAAIVRAVQAKGIGFVVAATWQGDRFLERRLKNRKCAPRYCPICRQAKRRRRGG